MNKTLNSPGIRYHIHRNPLYKYVSKSGTTTTTVRATVPSSSAAMAGKGDDDKRTEATEDVEAMVAPRRFRREIALSCCKHGRWVVDDGGDGTRNAEEEDPNIKKTRNLNMMMICSRRK